MGRFVGERGDGGVARGIEWEVEESRDGRDSWRERAILREVAGKEGGGTKGNLTPSATLRVERAAVMEARQSWRFECSLRLSVGMMLKSGDSPSGGRP